jgi:chromosome transmission fidelity protein 1
VYVRRTGIGHVELDCNLTFKPSLADDDEPEWMVEFAKKESRRAITEKRQEFESRLAKIRQEEERLKQAQDSDRPRKKQVRIPLSVAKNHMLNES